jgi:transglutaminase-like putative cysteine protease
MPRLKIRHETVYRYDNLVAFGTHRLLLRPRDSHAGRLVQASLVVSPQGEMRWLYDALGNCVCLFTPSGQSDELRISSQLIIDRYPAPLTPLSIEDPHSTFPIAYDQSDRAALAPFTNPMSGDEDEAFLSWLRDHAAYPRESLLSYLQRLNHTIFQEFQYAERYVEGVQSPDETVRYGGGACRDFAWLMVEALRRLGFAARFVTGYLYAPQLSAVRGAGATHAWCEVFLPHLGWLEFDPTNGLAESSDLIRVATTLTPVEAAPVSGTLIGVPGGSSLDVRVYVDLVEDVEAAAA